MTTSLRIAIETARTEVGGSLKYHTVLATQNDPYRLDTPANHKVGQWFAEQMDRLGLLGRSLHLRGIHYALLGSTTKPDAKPYENTDEAWQWLQNTAAKAGRWLDYVSFDDIVDARNEPPVIRVRGDSVETYVSVEPDIILPDIEDIEPRVGVTGFKGRQPYRLAFFGEKTSLAPILAPIAERYDADLYLPTGEISDTMLNAMAAAGNSDGRRMIVFTVADFDPAGWQMPISIGRKLQAFKDLKFHDLEFEVRPIALNREQVRTLGLPSSPLKETERRADKWRESMGWEQTEIDALATLQPDVLRKIIDDAVVLFYDFTLNDRVYIAERDWRIQAQAALDEQMDSDQISTVRAHAEEQIDEIRDQLREIEAMARTATDDLDVELPEVVIPTPAIDETLHGKPLISSEWPWPEQTAALKARKSYVNGGAS